MRAAARDYLTELRDRHQGSTPLMAAEAGVNRTDLYAKMKRYGIKPKRKYGGNAAWKALGEARAN